MPDGKCFSRADVKEDTDILSDACIRNCRHCVACQVAILFCITHRVACGQRFTTIHIKLIHISFFILRSMHLRRGGKGEKKKRACACAMIYKNRKRKRFAFARQNVAFHRALSRIITILFCHALIR